MVSRFSGIRVILPVFTSGGRDKGNLPVAVHENGVSLGLYWDSRLCPHQFLHCTNFRLVRKSFHERRVECQNYNCHPRPEKREPSYFGESLIFAEEFLEFLFERWDSWTASDLGGIVNLWILVKPSPIDFPALFTGCVFICVLIGLSVTTSLLRSAGHAVSCHVTWKKILRLKWRQVVAIRALFLFSFICFEMT